MYTVLYRPGAAVVSPLLAQLLLQLPELGGRVWYRNSMVHWYKSSLIKELSCALVVQERSGTRAVWYKNGLVQERSGTGVVWYRRSLVQERSDTEAFYSGTKTFWYRSILEQEHSGTEAVGVRVGFYYVTFNIYH